MKKKLAILGSTGSIGKNLLSIIDNNKNNLEILLLTANKDYNSLFNQAKKFKVKNLIITNEKSFKILKKKTLNTNIKVFNNFEAFKFIFKKKINYVMSSIIGLDGLIPTLKIIRHTEQIAIANKESIICGWSLIKKNLEKYNTKFIPVDSEHFSLWFGMRNLNIKNIEKFYLTASGGSILNKGINELNKISNNDVLKHPNWKMGKKITVDSATMINKIYEVIEAKNIFDIKLNQIEILIHPKSYVHAILKLENGLIKLIAHDTTMKIPIFNTLYNDPIKRVKTKKININFLNNLNLKKIDVKKFPMVKLLKLINNKHSLYDTVIVSANDTLVELFLKKKISFLDIQKKLFTTIKHKEFIKYKKISPKNTNQIVDLNDYVRLKILKKVYKT